MYPDFNRLKVFYVIFREGGVAAAAKKLHVSQSAVSQHLRKLEDELKIRLFTRLHKRLVPTSAGRQLARVLKPFVDHLDEVLQQIHRSGKGPGGTLHIGAPVEFGENYLPAIFAGFRQIYPAVGFRLELGHPTVLLPQVGDGRLDFAFADIFSDRTAYSRDLAIFSIETVAVEKLVLAGARSYYDAFVNGDHTAANLETCCFVAYQRRAPAVRSWFRHHFNQTPVHIQVGLTVESVRGVISGMKNGLGLGIVPSHTIRAEVADGELVRIGTGKKEMVNRISLVQLQDKVPGPAEKAFLTHFLSEMPHAMRAVVSDAPALRPQEETSLKKERG